MVISHNLAAMNANRMFNINNKKGKAMTEKLSSGYKINRAADDAAGLSISEKMRRQIRSLNQGMNNIQDGISWVQTADGAMEEVNDMLHRIVELSVKAANGILTDEDRLMIDDEIKHLKNEINRVGSTTTFNDEKIFLQPENEYPVYVSVEAEGTLKDLNLFNSTYDSQTGEVSYGGFIFKGNRVSWDKVDPNMVYPDPATGEMLFREGIYTYTDSSNNTLKIECKEGAKVPEITRVLNVTASTKGITVEGNLYSWNNFVDEYGKPASKDNIHDGEWTLEIDDLKISYYFQDPIYELSEMINGINGSKDENFKYTLKENYVGGINEQATDMELDIKDVKIPEDFKDLLVNDNTPYTIRAGKDASKNEDGIWLEDGNGNRIEESFKSWSSMGINSWDNGAYISSDLNYSYQDTEGNKDTNITFTFDLSDVTSVDSVIDGLDGVNVYSQNYKSDYSVDATISGVTHITLNNSEFTGSVNFKEEIDLARDFDIEIDDVDDANITYDDTSGTSKLIFGNDVIEYNGSTEEGKNSLIDDISTYIDLITREKENAVLNGTNPNSVVVTRPNLTDIVGTGNITTSGYFNDIVTINDNAMVKTDGSPSFEPGKDGETYPTAFIDFAGLGTAYDLDDLLGAGFNSTCKTCDNHYSVVFVDSITSGSSTTTEGYNYKKSKQGDNNYLLQIDLNSLKGKNVADAIVSITSEAYDFHYTQYAAEGSKLYIYDNRAQGTGTTAATFDTNPFVGIDESLLAFELQTVDGDKINLEYTYNFADIKDCINVSMEENTADNGKYIEKIDPDTGNISYILNDFSDLTVKSFDLKTSYTLDGTNYDSEDVFKKAYAEKSVEEMLTNTNVKLKTNDYSYLSFKADEYDNTAISSLFEAGVSKEKEIKKSIPGLNIQCNVHSIDRIEIPRFELNTFDLRIYRASTKTIKAAEATIDMVNEALHRLTEKRATYGAYQNRLEHAYNNNYNTSENTSAAESRIRDTDMATEMVKFSNNNILAQAGQAMLAQANQANQGVLSLLG